MPSLTFFGSGIGTGVFAAGEGSTDTGVCLGVDKTDAAVGAGDAVSVRELGLSCSCSRGRFGSGCFAPLSCVATEASLGVSTVSSVAGGGVVSRFRLFDGRKADFFFCDKGVPTGAVIASFMFSAACCSLLETFSSS
jgi:hypothetical protein